MSCAGERCSCSISHGSIPGSTLPLRVAITSPSSGVKPIVVSQERPPSIAHSDAPAPKWQLTILAPAAPATSSGTRAATHEWESPWKPKRRSGWRSRQAAGSA